MIIRNDRCRIYRNVNQLHPRNTCTRRLRDHKVRRGHPRRSRIVGNLRSRFRNPPHRRNSHERRTKACRDTDRSSDRNERNYCQSGRNRMLKNELPMSIEELNYLDISRRNIIEFEFLFFFCILLFDFWYIIFYFLVYNVKTCSV